VPAMSSRRFVSAAISPEREVSVSIAANSKLPSLARPDDRAHQTYAKQQAGQLCSAPLG